MENYTHDAFKVSGYKIRTTNKDKQSGKDIMAAWAKWRDENLADLVQGKNNETLHCIYFNYENAENQDERSYDLLIGFTTDIEALQTSELITTIEIPAQNYKYTLVPREDFQGFLSKWREINDMTDLNRTFGYDMDMYTEKEICIAVSVK